MTKTETIATHTPGPWAINDCFETSLGISRRGDQLIIAEVWSMKAEDEFDVHGVIGPEGRANAALIVAAPEMLAALEYVADLTGIALSKDHSEVLRKRCLAAIAKAKGQS